MFSQASIEHTSIVNKVGLRVCIIKLNFKVNLSKEKETRENMSSNDKWSVLHIKPTYRKNAFNEKTFNRRQTAHENTNYDINQTTKRGHKEFPLLRVKLHSQANFTTSAL